MLKRHEVESEESFTDVGFFKAHYEYFTPLKDRVGNYVDYPNVL